MVAEKKNGNGKRARSAGSWTIEGLGKVVVPVRIYSTAKDKDDRASFNQYHGHDAGRIRYKKVCEICGNGNEVAPSEIVKGKMYGDKLISFTDEELESFKKTKTGKIVIKSLKPKEHFKPDMFCDTKYVGTAKDAGGQPFKLLHDVMKEYQNRVALVSWVDRGHDHAGIMSVFDNGFLIQEITPKYLFKGFGQVDIAQAEIPKQLVERGYEIAKKMFDDTPFNHDEIVDAYPETVNKVTDLKAMGEEIPAEALPQAKAEATDLEAMLDAS